MERRPIISQEKPSVSRIKTVPKPDLKKATPKLSAAKPSINPQKTVTKTARVETSSKKPAVKTESVKGPRASRNPEPAQVKKLTKKISPRTSNQKQDQKLPNKLSKSDYLNEEKKVVKTHDRSLTRTLSPSEVKILPVKREHLDDQLMALEVENASENEEETDYEDDFEVGLIFFQGNLNIFFL